MCIRDRLCDVVFIAYAGVAANRRLLLLLERRCASVAAARRVFWSWLCGNLFLGAQLAWTLNGVDLNSYRCDYCHQWHIGKRFRDD